MRNIAVKTNGTTNLDAGDWNANQAELENLVLGTDQSLDPAGGADTDLNMMGKASAGYSGAGWAYTDSGAANAYVLSQANSLQAPTKYFDNMMVAFKPGATNTGASTVNVASLGVKDIKLRGSTLQAGDILVNKDIILRYSNSSGYFELISGDNRSIITVNIAEPEWGAIGDGVTDNTTAIQNAMNSLGANGGRVVVPNGKYVVDSDLTIPAGVSLASSYIMQEWRSVDALNTKGGQILLNSTATINMGFDTGIDGLVILRKGITFPVAAADLVNYAGTAITIPANIHGTYVGHSMIVGFTTAIDSDNATGNQRFRAEYLNIDCTNGILLQNFPDIPYIRECHAWPFASASTGVDANLRRGGAAFKVIDVGDWAKILNCFSFGYARGFVVEDANSCSLIGCGADQPTTLGASTPIGFEVTGSSAEITLINCQAAGQQQGFRFNQTAAANESFKMIGCTAWDNDSNHILIDDGKGIITGCKIRGGAGDGIDVSGGGPVLINNNYFEDIGADAINNTGAFEVYIQDNYFEGVVGNNVTGVYTKSIASVDPLVLDANNKLFLVTGTTNFGTLNSPADYTGQIVTLVFSGVLQVTDGGNMNLAGNFNTTANDSLTLMSIGTGWVEIARSVN